VLKQTKKNAPTIRKAKTTAKAGESGVKTAQRVFRKVLEKADPETPRP